jgi:tRNA/rRNA methyltransferase/tRNA (cytidine32/uridine32-2'-O)-methyltransferase
LQRLHPTRNELSALFGLLRNLAGKPARLEHAAEKAAKQAALSAEQESAQKAEAKDSQKSK